MKIRRLGGGFREMDIQTSGRRRGNRLFLSLAAFFLGRIALTPALVGQPGVLDTAFNSGIDTGTGPVSVRALAVQADSRILVGGGTFNFSGGGVRVGLARLLSDGTPDDTFEQHNADGSGVFSLVDSVAVKSGGLVVARGIMLGTNGYGVAAFQPNGTRDTGYNPGVDPDPFAVRQSDGKRLVLDPPDGFRSSRILRFNPDGSPDPSFNSLNLGFGSGDVNGSNITAIAVQSNDKIVVSTETGRPFSDHGHVFRLERNGDWDNGFNPASADLSIYAVAVQPDGGILVGGTFFKVNGVSRGNLARLIGDAIGVRPVITLSPADQLTLAGGGVEFSVSVSSAEPPTYQWRFNHTNDIPGATNRILQLTNVQAAQAGDYFVRVGNSAGFVESAAARLVVLPTKCPAPSFVQGPSLVPETSLTGLVAGDFNGDGKVDLAATDSATNRVDVLLGNGDGTFSAPVQYPVGASPVAISTGDFNGDGRLDLAVANFNSHNVSILLGNGGGTFQAAVNVPLDDFAYPTGMAVADLNGDGKRDLILAYFNSGRVAVLLGRGDGTFDNAVTYPTGAPPVTSVASGAYTVAAGDFNGDGIPDVVATNAGRIGDPLAPGSRISGSISVLLGNGDGTLQAGRVQYLPAFPYVAAVGDFNGDGNADVAVANHGAPSGEPQVSGVSVLLGRGDGTFQDPSNFDAGAAPLDVALGDFNGDGRADLVVTDQGNSPNYSDGGVSVLFGKGDGTFQPAVTLNPGVPSRSVAVGDFNSDGQVDLAVAANSSSVLLNSCDASAFSLSPARGESSLTVSWPLSLSGFDLESTASPGLTNWQSVAETPSTNSGRFELVVPLDQPQRVFRLHRK